MNLNKKIYGQIEAWRSQPIEGAQPYSTSTASCSKRNWADLVRNVSLLVVAISVNADDYRQTLGIVEGAKEDRAGWSAFWAISRNAASPASCRSSRMPAWA
jgi:putative transposase